MSDSTCSGRQALLSTIRILRWPFYENDRARAEGDTAGHVKIVAIADGTIIGATIVGRGAADQIGTWALAVERGSEYPRSCRLGIALSDPGGSGQIRVNRLSRPRFDANLVAPHHGSVTEARLIITVSVLAGRDDQSGRSPARVRAPRFGLSGKLLVLTILFVMIAEVMIYVPSVSNFRLNWLNDRLAAARTAALVLYAAPSGMVPEDLARDILDATSARRRWR